NNAGGYQAGGQARRRARCQDKDIVGFAERLAELRLEAVHGRSEIRKPLVLVAVAQERQPALRLWNGGSDQREAIFPGSVSRRHRTLGIAPQQRLTQSTVPRSGW